MHYKHPTFTAIPGTSTLLVLHSPSSPPPSLCPLTPLYYRGCPHPTQGPGSVSSLHLEVFIPRGEKEERTVLVGQEDALWTAQHLMVGQDLSPMGHRRRARGLQGAVVPPSWLPDLSRELGSYKPPEHQCSFPRQAEQGPMLSSTQLPVLQLQLPEVPGQLSTYLQPAQRGAGAGEPPAQQLHHRATISTSGVGNPTRNCSLPSGVSACAGDGAARQCPRGLEGRTAAATGM